MMTRLLFLLAVAVPVYAFTSAQLVIPSITGISNGSNHAALELHCVRWIAKADVTVTRLTGAIVASTGSNVSFGFYVDADAGALLQSVSGYAPYATPGIAFSGTTSPYAVVAGTRYRVCACGDGNYYTADVPDVQGDGITAAVSLARMLNSGLTGAVVVGLAANACTGAAVLPATTGALTARDTPLTTVVIE